MPILLDRSSPNSNSQTGAIQGGQVIRYSANFDPTLIGPFDPANDAPEQ